MSFRQRAGLAFVCSRNLFLVSNVHPLSCLRQVLNDISSSVRKQLVPVSCRFLSSDGVKRLSNVAASVCIVFKYEICSPFSVYEDSLLIAFYVATARII